MLKNTIPQTTFCRVLTGRGRSAIAVIQVSGPSAWKWVCDCMEFANDGELASGQVRFGQWSGSKVDNQDVPPESVVVSLNSGGAIEVHCHGGAAAIERILSDLREAGAELAGDPLGLGDTVLQDEALRALSQCKTERMAVIALDQVRGALADWTQHWLKRLDIGAKELDARDQALAEFRRDAIQVSRWGEMGIRLGIPFRVVLIGLPNVGKSTIMNRIVGWDRSITYDAPGTTRDVLHASTVLEGLPIQLTDTAGIRESDEVIEREGVRRSEREIHAADVVVTITDTWSRDDSPRSPELIASVMSSVSPERWIRVLNKADRLYADERADAATDSRLIQTVATTGIGIERLQREIVDSISKSLPPPHVAVPVTSRQQAIVKRMTSVENIDVACQMIQELHGRLNVLD